MPEDLKILEPVGANQTLRAQIWPHPARVDGSYSLVQRITKCLLTAPDENEADPEFGADLQGAVAGIAGQEDNRAKQAVSTALRKCLDDLRIDPPDDPEQRLVALRLLDLVYAPEDTSWRATVEVETEATILSFDLGT